MKIGIYTIHHVNNYGAMLQAYATQKALKNAGFESELVDLYPIRLEKDNKYFSPATSIKNIIKNILSALNPRIKQKSRNFSLFHKRLQLSKRYYSIDEVYKNPPQYDIHLVGSDQVWNLENGLSNKNLFFLEFLPNEATRISYASSFGSENICLKEKDILTNLLSKFKYLSVRENSAVEIIKKYTGINAVQVMDPTFLLSREEWDQLAGDEPLIKGEYVIAYGFSEKETTNLFIKNIREKLNIPIIGMSVSPYHPFDYDSFYQEAGPIEFLNLIKYAKFVITASYHGAAFAIHFRKDFLVSRHPTRNTRIESMLNITGLQERMIDLSNPQSYLGKTFKTDYSIIESLIRSASEHSLDWLLNSIKKSVIYK